MTKTKPDPNRNPKPKPNTDQAGPAGVHAAVTQGREISEMEARREIWDEPGGEVMAAHEDEAAKEEQARPGGSNKKA